MFYTGAKNLKLEVNRKIDKQLGLGKEPENLLLANMRLKVQKVQKTVQE